MHLYRRRVAAGMELAAMEQFRGDYLETVSVARTRGWLLSFTSKGHVHFLKVEDIPEGSRASRGKSIWALLGVDGRDHIVATLSIDDLGEDRYLTFATRGGLLKRTRLGEFSNPKAGGIIAMRVRPADGMLDVKSTYGDTEFLLVSRNGRAIRFPERDVPVVGRVAQGVKGIGLQGGDEVIALVVAVREASILMVADSGAGKRTPISEFPLQRRGGLGALVAPMTGDRTSLVAAMEALDDDKVVLISAGGVLTGLGAGEVPVQRRNSRARAVVALAPGDRIVDVTRLHGEVPAQGPQFDLLGPA